MLERAEQKTTWISNRRYGPLPRFANHRCGKQAISLRKTPIPRAAALSARPISVCSKLLHATKAYEIADDTFLSIKLVQKEIQSGFYSLNERISQLY